MLGGPGHGMVERAPSVLLCRSKFRLAAPSAGSSVQFLRLSVNSSLFRFLVPSPPLPIASCFFIIFITMYDNISAL